MFGSPNRRRVQVDTGEFTYTKQSAKDECDINNILSQYKRTGMLAHINASAYQYIDLPSELDYQASINLVLNAQTAFASLPAKIRDEFGSDPSAFLNALYDPSQRSRMEELGVLRPATALDVAIDNTPPASSK